MNAQELIEQARDYHASFTPQAVPLVPALKTLERLQKQMVAAVVQENPAALAEWEVYSPVPADWESGIVLPDNLAVLGVEASYLDGTQTRGWEVSVLTQAQGLSQPHLYPSAYVMGSLLHLTDLRQWYGEAHGWEDITRLRVRYVPVPPDLARETSPLILPDSAAPALVANLALWMADRTGANLPNLRAEAASSGAGWVALMVNTGPRSWQVEVVY